MSNNQQGRGGRGRGGRQGGRGGRGHQPWRGGRQSGRAGRVQRGGRQATGRGRQATGRGSGRENHTFEPNNMTEQQQQQQEQQQLQQQQQLLPEQNIFNGQHVLTTGLSLAGFSLIRQNVSAKLNEQRFRVFFGIGSKSASVLFQKVKEKYDDAILDKFMMALNWLKLYDPESVLASRWNLSEETLRVNIRSYIKHIASLKEDIIVWGAFGSEIFIVSVDGTHCPIYEPRTDPSSKWFSHKFNGPGVAYELAISIFKNQLVWINGPFPASKHDITIFRSEDDPSAGLMSRIPEGKRAIGDSGYSGEPTKVSITRDDDDKETKKFKARFL